MLLPAAERRNDISFWVPLPLPYPVRLLLALCLAAAGMAWQVWSPGMVSFAGCALVFAGTALLLTRGYTNKARTEGGGEWRPARRADVERVIATAKTEKAWDRDWLDITCGRGFFLFLVICAGVWYAMAQTLFTPGFGLFIACNTVAGLMPFWITGVRSYLKKDALIIKAETLLWLEGQFNGVRGAGESFNYQLQTKTAGDGGEVPVDLKAMVRWEDGPPGILGLLVQISINDVKGTEYPYAYCVIVARPEAAGAVSPRPGDEAAGITLETEPGGDTHVVVVRQTTTKNTGYHTEKADIMRLFTRALAMTRHGIRTLSGQTP